MLLLTINRDAVREEDGTMKEEILQNLLLQVPLLPLITDKCVNDWVFLSRLHAQTSRELKKKRKKCAQSMLQTLVWCQSVWTGDAALRATGPSLFAVRYLLQGCRGQCSFIKIHLFG